MNTKDKIKAWLIGSVFLGALLQMVLGIANYSVLIPGTYANDNGAIRLSWKRDFVWQEDGFELTGIYKKEGGSWWLRFQGPLARFADDKVDVISSSGRPAIKIGSGSDSEYVRAFSFSDTAAAFGTSAVLIGGVMIAKFIATKCAQKETESETTDEMRENKMEEKESAEGTAGIEDKRVTMGLNRILQKGSAINLSGKKGKAILLAVSVFLLCLFLFTEICDNCGALILGKGYYTPEAMFSAEAMKYTLCDTCADELWSPFNYKTRAK